MINFFYFSFLHILVIYNLQSQIPPFTYNNYQCLNSIIQNYIFQIAWVWTQSQPFQKTQIINRLFEMNNHKLHFLYYLFYIF
jgi:hypothetical protein